MGRPVALSLLVEKTTSTTASWTSVLDLRENPERGETDDDLEIASLRWYLLRYVVEHCLCDASSTRDSRKSSHATNTGLPACKSSTPSCGSVAPARVSVIVLPSVSNSVGELASCCALGAASSSVRSIPNSCPIASFASTTVLELERTIMGCGRYCKAVKAMPAAPRADGILIESDSRLRSAIAASPFSPFHVADPK